jgi:F420-dependent oxidoreductase-like protein
LKIALMLDYSEDMKAAVSQIAELEAVGLDQVWIPEPYGFDAISLVGYIAARTTRLEIGTAIVNVFSRTAALMAMTAAGCDYVSGGRFNLGLGASGPQVIEGFHGVPFAHPMQRIVEYIDVCRLAWQRRPLVYDGQTVHLPGTDESGTPQRALKLISQPVREHIPIWWASLKGRSVVRTAEVADGWLPTMFLPEQHQLIWGNELQAGRVRRPGHLGPLQIAAGGLLSIGEHLRNDEAARVLDRARQSTALYVGGMGAPGANFYNDVFASYGYGDQARQIQALFIAGHRAEAAACVPLDWSERTNLVGPPSLIRERVAAYREAGVTSLLVTPANPGLEQFELLRSIVDEAR